MFFSTLITLALFLASAVRAAPIPPPLAGVIAGAEGEIGAVVPGLAALDGIADAGLVGTVLKRQLELPVGVTTAVSTLETVVAAAVAKVGVSDVGALSASTVSGVLVDIKGALVEAVATVKEVVDIKVLKRDVVSDLASGLTDVITPFVSFVGGLATDVLGDSVVASLLSDVDGLYGDLLSGVSPISTPVLSIVGGLLTEVGAVATLKGLGLLSIVNLVL